MLCTKRMAEQSDAPKSPVSRDFESYFFGGDWVIAAVRTTELLGLALSHFGRATVYSRRVSTSRLVALDPLP